MKKCELRKLNFSIVEQFVLEGTSGADMVQPTAQSWTSFYTGSVFSVPYSTEFWISPKIEILVLCILLFK